MATGGVSSGKRKKGKKRKPRASGFPPLGTYDPAILQQTRADSRRVRDLLAALEQEGKRAKKDKKQANRSLKRDYAEAREDLATQLQRGTRDIERGREDLRISHGRSMEDFRTRLGDLARVSARTGEVQTQSANIAGVTGGGSLQAAAAIRRRNLAEAEKPIETSMGRATEDLERSMGELGVAEEELREDVDRSQTRLRKDRRQARRAIRRDYRQGRRDRKQQASIAERERLLGRRNAQQSAEHQAYTLNPGAFNPPKRYRR